MSNRQKGFRKTRPGIVILGEGLTEQFYFQHLKRIKGLHCTVEPRLQTNTSISSFEKKNKDLIENDIHVICVFDADVAEKNQVEKDRLNEFKEKFGAHPKVTLCDSLPSLEYWFLLHFQEGKSVTCDARSVTRTLKKHIVNYSKTKKFLNNEKWVRDMTEGKGNLDQAMQRAEDAVTIEKPDHCPYSNVFKGIRLMMSH